jgi:hypothetical protein
MADLITDSSPLSFTTLASKFIKNSKFEQTYLLRKQEKLKSVSGTNQYKVAQNQVFPFPKKQAKSTKAICVEMFLSELQETQKNLKMNNNGTDPISINILNQKKINQDNKTRKDVYGVQIIKGSKRHKVTFLDDICKKGVLVDYVEINNTENINFEDDNTQDIITNKLKQGTDESTSCCIVF